MGLGNPGAEYRDTRHNIGFHVIDALASRHHTAMSLDKPSKALVATATISSKRVVLAAPQTYMNLSGESLAQLVPRHGIVDPHQIVVVHDEIDLPVGTMRVKRGGGSAGNNGIRSVDAHLGTPDYARIRIGVGRPPSAAAGKGHVLAKPSKAEQAELDVMVELAADAVETYLVHGLDETMNRFNRRSRD